MELRPIRRDGYFGPYVQLQLVRIDLLVGEPERTLDQLEPLGGRQPRIAPRLRHSLPRSDYCGHSDLLEEAERAVAPQILTTDSPDW